MTGFIIGVLVGAAGLVVIDMRAKSRLEAFETRLKALVAQAKSTI
jgi:hypothetical protein